MAKTEEIDQGLVKALAHPLRVQILHILGKQVASPKQIAGLIDEPLGNVSYHAKVLLDYDCIELVKEEPRRGAVEHFYRAKPQAALGSRSWQKVPPSLRSDLVAASLDGFTSRAIAALKSGAFQAREGSALSWFPLMVDEAGWKKLLEITEDAEKRFQKVAQESLERLDEPGAGVPVVVAISAFQVEGCEGRRSK